MPRYEYLCQECGRFELWQAFEDTALSTCPHCGSAVRKIYSVPTIYFPGKALTEELTEAAEYDARHPVRRAK